MKTVAALLSGTSNIEFVPGILQTADRVGSTPVGAALSGGRAEKDAVRETDDLVRERLAREFWNPGTDHDPLIDELRADPKAARFMLNCLRLGLEMEAAFSAGRAPCGEVK